MFSLIYNEIRKLLSRKKTLVLVLAFTLLVGFVMFGSYKEDQNRKRYNSREYKIQMTEEAIENLKQIAKDTKIPADERKHYEEEISINEEQLKILKETPEGKEIDWKQDIKLRIKDIESTINEKGIDKSYKETLKLRLEQYNYLLNNNIKYDEDNLNAFNFLKILFEILGSIFLAVGVVMFTGDMVSGEYTPPTMKFLITQPVSRGKVLFSKFIAVVCTSVLMILTIEIISYILMGFMFGFGDANYPMFVGTKYEFDLTVAAGEGHPLKVVAGSTYIIARWSFIIRAFLLQILFIIAAASFAFLLSVVLKSSMVSTSLGIVTVVALTIFQNIPYVRKGVLYVFSIYGDPLSLMQGQMASMLQEPMITTPFAVIILVVWSILCYVISHFVFVKRDILI